MVAGWMSRVASRQAGAIRAAENNREALPGIPHDAPAIFRSATYELLSKKRVLRNQFHTTSLHD